jgi:hypothetical protein
MNYSANAVALAKCMKLARGVAQGLVDDAEMSFWGTKFLLSARDVAQGLINNVKFAR